jgi:hypothetical protein
VFPWLRATLALLLTFAGASATAQVRTTITVASFPDLDRAAQAALQR